jgi:hypothetical protein
MKTIITALKTLTDSLRVVGRSRSFSLYPLLSFLIMLLLTYMAIIPLFERVLAAVLGRSLDYLVRISEPILLVHHAGSLDAV